MKLNGAASMIRALPPRGMARGCTAPQSALGLTRQSSSWRTCKRNHHAANLSSCPASKTPTRTTHCVAWPSKQGARKAPSHSQGDPAERAAGARAAAAQVVNGEDGCGDGGGAQPEEH